MTKANMIKFILSFETYPTMNSWNQSYGYSYNVKIHSLPLTKKQKEKLYEMLETDEFSFDLNTVIEDWQDNEMFEFGTHINGKERQKNLAIDDSRRKNGQLYEWVENTIKETNFQAGFNGRNGGHLVLYKWNDHNMVGTGWTHNEEELKEMSIEDVKYVYNVLKKFEGLYHTLISQCEYMADNFKTENEEYTETKTRKILVNN